MYTACAHSNKVAVPGLASFEDPFETVTVHKLTQLVGFGSTALRFQLAKPRHTCHRRLWKVFHFPPVGCRDSRGSMRELNSTICTVLLHVRLRFMLFVEIDGGLRTS